MKPTQDIILCCLIVVLGCFVLFGRPPREKLKGWRKDFIELNTAVLSLSNRMAQLNISQRTNLALIDVGPAPDTLEGDTVSGAIQKMATNISICEGFLK